MSFQPGRARPRDRGVDPDANTNNPTVVLPNMGGNDRLDDAEYWAGQPGYGEPDVVELPRPGFPLRTATEDLWAISSTQGAWRKSKAGSGESDFLIIEPALTAQASNPPESAPPITQNAGQSTPSLPTATQSAGNSYATSWSSRSTVPNEDPLRKIALTIQAAIEQHLQQQGEMLPMERTPEHVDLVRRMALNYLRHDRVAAEEIPDAAEGERLLCAVVDEVLGYGPLDPLLRDETVSEIMVTGPHMTYVEQGGRLHEVPVHFEDDAHLLRIIQKILQPLNLSVSAESPIADGRLADGSTINVVVPPSAISGPTLTIRRIARRAFSLEQLVRMDTLSLHMADFLRLCVAARLNIAICGVGGAGKTTMLNALASSIDDHERIVTVEEVAELLLHHRHLVRLEAPPAQPKTPVTLTRLLKNALHMRPERLLVGECQGNEALTIVQAMNTGFDGTMTTLYATAPRDLVVRFEALCLGANAGISSLAVRQQIATGLDLIIYCARLRDGTRRVMSITDVHGMEGDQIVAHDLFLFREAGLDMTTGRIRGEFTATGVRPSFANRLEDNSAQGFPLQYFPRGA